jgi:hypothetical protein
VAPAADARICDPGKIQAAAVVDPGSDHDDARRLIQVIRQQGSEQEWTQVVGRERELEAVDRGAVAVLTMPALLTRSLSGG